jgi:FKBP-type peptidyl-prolyl cis-trans isomerase FklB
MKKTLLAIAILTSASVFSIYAKKKPSKQKQVFNQQLILKSEIDSLSYAYGVGTAKQGLDQYLVQLGVIADTANITDRTELASIKAANEQNINSFLEGMNDRLNSNTKSAAYYSGLEIASQLTRMSEQFAKQVLAQESGSSNDLNMNAVVAGIANVIQNKSLLISNSDELVQAKMNVAQSKAEEKKKEEWAPRIEAGERFMSEVKKKPGVVALPSGVLYKIDKKGNGAIPTANDRVKVHYTGKLNNGKVFDSSVDRGEPLTFGVTQVIPGWTEVLQLMPVGSKWTVYIPYDQAYGETGAGAIEPYSNLIFEIELLDIEK